MNRLLAVAAIGLVPVLSVGGAAGAAFLGSHAKAPVAAPPKPVRTPPPPADLFVQLAHSSRPDNGATLGGVGGVWTPILHLRVPAGHWVLQAEETIVNVGGSDYARCAIGESSKDAWNEQSTFVGDTGSATMADVIAETAAVTLPKPATVTVFCEHDTTTGYSNYPYVDAGADLWAHPAARLAAAKAGSLWTEARGRYCLAGTGSASSSASAGWAPSGGPPTCCSSVRSRSS
jgi:hypothetical protein